jgi:asparagine synthase (glutamine-hydrolysing)
MCGVIAIVGRRGQAVPGDAVRLGGQSLAHRGPDDAGDYFSGAIGFGFRRLSIIDPTPGGHQPMTSPDGALTLVFNGEIYNYLEVRAELAALGHVFRSASDTEVLLVAYRQWGADCVHHFNGMWAFLIHDRRDGTLFGARDRLGVKPLYLWQDDAWCVFASEPRAIGATGLVALRPDMQRLADSIRWERMDHDAGTCLAGIRQIPAGHRFRVDAQGVLTQERYWSVPDEARDAGAGIVRSEADWIDELARLVTDAVRLRLRSDVPVGFTLSGGIDSSLLICEAAQLNAGQGALLAFSYQDGQYDEREPIADTVVQTGARLVRVRDEELDMAARLPRAVQANGEPVHSLSAVANHSLFAMARQHGVKVLLGGQGADEAFAGYTSYQWDQWHSLADDRRWGALLADVRGYAGLNRRSAFALLASTLTRSLRIALSGSALYRRLRPRAPERSADIHSVFAPEFLHTATAPALQRADYRLAAMQKRALTDWPLPMYLRIEDRLSMAESVEARLPFTDYRLVELAMRMPDSLKFAGGVNKTALRRVAQGRVPASVTGRMRKLGFPIGHGLQTARGLHRLCTGLAATQAFRERGIYDTGAVARLLGREAREQDVDTLFHLAQTELWLAGISAAKDAG